MKKPAAGKVWMIPMAMSLMCALFAGVAIMWWGTIILALVAVGLWGIALWLEREGV